MGVFSSVVVETNKPCGECDKTIAIYWCPFCKVGHPRRYVCRYCRNHHLAVRHENWRKRGGRKGED